MAPADAHMRAARLLEREGGAGELLS